MPALVRVTNVKEESFACQREVPVLSGRRLLFQQFGGAIHYSDHHRPAAPATCPPLSQCPSLATLLSVLDEAGPANTVGGGRGTTFPGTKICSCPPRCHGRDQGVASTLCFYSRSFPLAHPPTSGPAACVLCVPQLTKTAAVCGRGPALFLHGSLVVLLWEEPWARLSPWRDVCPKKG